MNNTEVNIYHQYTYGFIYYNKYNEFQVSSTNYNTLIVRGGAGESSAVRYRRATIPYRRKMMGSVLRQQTWEVVGPLSHVDNVGTAWYQKFNTLTEKGVRIFKMRIFINELS